MFVLCAASSSPLCSRVLLPHPAKLQTLHIPRSGHQAARAATEAAEAQPLFKTQAHQRQTTLTCIWCNSQWAGSLRRVGHMRNSAFVVVVFVSVSRCTPVRQQRMRTCTASVRWRELNWWGTISEDIARTRCSRHESPSYMTNTNNADGLWRKSAFWMESWGTATTIAGKEANPEERSRKQRHRWQGQGFGSAETLL